MGPALTETGDMKNPHSAIAGVGVQEKVANLFRSARAGEHVDEYDHDDRDEMKERLAHGHKLTARGRKIKERFFRLAWPS
jgi:hypothetical protein